MRERRLGRAVAAPGLVRLDGGIRAEVDDPRVGGEAGERELDERERSEHVDLVDATQLVERVLPEQRQRRGAEHAGVVDEEVDRVPGSLDEAAPVLGVGDVAGERDDAVEPADSALERISVARVDDEAPAPLGQGAREREPEAAGGAGDDPVRVFIPSR